MNTLNTTPLDEITLNAAARAVADPEAGSARGYVASGEREKSLIGVNAKTSLYPPGLGWKGKRRRILGGKSAPSNCYHVMSRTCGGAVHFDALEKEALRRILRRLAEFSGVRILTYCIMKNHFHVLAEVPEQKKWLERFDGPEGEEKLIRHLSTLYSKAYVEILQMELAEWRRLKYNDLAEKKIAAIRRRFCDISIFIKEVKERFSRWFNKRHTRKGTLWMDRFKSVLVEGRGDPLRTMSAYIDLNPVRAGVVSDPKDYRWCGYAEALAGDAECQRGICRATSNADDVWKRFDVAAVYRKLLFTNAVEMRDDKQQVARRGVSRAAAVEVLKKKGKLSLSELVTHRVRHFSDGAVLGSREFVEEVFKKRRNLFNPKRKSGARRIPHLESPLFTLRQLSAQPLGHAIPPTLPKGASNAP